ncbi:MAG: sensor histidine kinase [Marmoricola sp.]
MRLRRPSTLDWVIAAVVCVVGVADLAETVRGPRPVAAVAILVYVACLLLRRTSLWTAVVVGFGTIVVTFSLGLSQENFLSSVIACLVLVWWVGYALPARESVLGCCFAYACVAGTSADGVTNLVWLVLVVGGAWAAGRALRSRRLLIEDLQRTTAALERSREELADRAVATERLRVAQEVHDIVAHSVTVMLVQAEAAGRVLQSSAADPVAVEALHAVQESGRGALAELRQLLGVLRPQGPALTAPAPGLADIATLASSYRDAGLQVTCGPPACGDLPATVQLTAYRVIQEALTNTLRHSRASEARVDVASVGGVLRVEVVDPGPARPDTGQPGHGLVGMRERVEACGGEVVAGPWQEGFRVLVTVPVAAGEPIAPVEHLAPTVVPVPGTAS